MEVEIKKNQPKNYLGRIVSIEKEFIVSGTWNSYNAACSWLNENGYSFGSMCGDMPIAITKGEYNLPQKWYNISKWGRGTIAGVITGEFREGTALIRIFA